MVKRRKSPKDKLIAFKVSLILPQGLSSDDVRDYIQSSVHGAGDPGDPLWNIDPDTVKVTRLRPQRRSPVTRK